jgi:Pacifastin inhibitor (LCMII)
MLEQRLWILLACALCAASCTRQRPEANSSETHFLAPCEAGGCGAGLECLCGVCTRACQDDGACNGLPGYVECGMPSEASCNPVLACTATCQGKADCDALGTGFVCNGGICSIPGVDPSPQDAAVADATTDAGRCPGGCDNGDGCKQRGETWPSQCNSCTCLDNGQIGCTTAACLRHPPPCEPGDCAVGDFCYWNSANGFSVDGCSLCECLNGVYSCDFKDCSGADAGITCNPGDCQIGDACYPNNGTNIPALDGCNTCVCRDGQGSCTERFCGLDVGTRCADSARCKPDLTCRTDFTGERPICTRECGPTGCPRGSECVREVPSYTGGMIDNACLRPCDDQSDCTPYMTTCTDLAAFGGVRYCL